MAQPEVVVPFDPNDNTAKADFTIPADTSVLKDQNVLVTGGASGLGLLLSRELASHGSDTMSMRRQEKLHLTF